MAKDFSYDIRVLACQLCGAPIDVGTAGGSAKCEYCGAVNQITARQPEARLEVEDISEEERLRRLWAQDGKPIPPPDAVAALLSNGTLPSQKVGEALNLFNSTRKEVESSSDFAASERLTFLTLILYNHYVTGDETKRQRAILESAVEAFKIPRHKQFVLGILTRSAVKDGDIETAKKWLSPCNPRSDDLRADTTYRVGQALIDTAQGSYDSVHKLLGEGVKDVPIADGYQSIATLLRANAFEKRGHMERAKAVIREFAASGDPHGVKGLEFVASVYPSLGLCQQSIQGVTAGATGSPTPRNSASGKSALTTVGLIFLIVAAILIGVGYLIGGTSRELVANGVKTEGTVTSLTSRRSNTTDMTDGRMSFYPVFTFTSEDGQVINFQSNVGGNPPSFAVGEKVEILYQADNPQEASINSFFQLWGVMVILMGVGILLALIGLLLLISGKAKPKG